jgi:VWFA-related protein
LDLSSLRKSEGGKVKGSRNLGWPKWALLLILAAWGTLGAGQQDQQKPRPDIPDAPSATRPAQPFPQPTVPATTPTSQPTQPTPDATPPNQPPPSEDAPPAEPPPVPEIKTVPEGGATPSPPSTDSRDQLYTLTAHVNFVVLPVTVKDKSGKMVPGLTAKDFAVFENGQKQKLTFFTSDPFFLSAAVVLDYGLPDVAVQKIGETFSALLGSFSQWDQVSVYTYSTSVTKLTDFTPPDRKLEARLNQLKCDPADSKKPCARGRTGSAPMMGGPLGSPPTVNGIPIGSGAPPVNTPPREAHTLNDAILRAALDLAKQDRTRRKVIFVISDGRELGSTASYADTLKVLLTNQIAVYGVATDSSSLPGYKQLSRLHLPRQGYDNLLPKYAAATGGQVFTEFSQNAIETAYQAAMGQARNQYTLGYQAKAATSSAYRDVEVKVDIPHLDVITKYGYYPLPPARETPPVTP